MPPTTTNFETAPPRGAVAPAAPARSRPAAPGLRAEWVPHAAFVVLLASVAWVVFFRHAYVHFDTIYAYTWGRDLFEGHVPDFDVPQSPTPHPLGILVGGLLSLLGQGAGYQAMLIVITLSWAVLVWGIYRLATAVFDTRIGVFAAVIMATSFSVLLRSVASFFDVPAVALVLVAASLEARQPRRGAPVVALLALAGLLRPEIWLLSACYLLYLAWPQLSKRTIDRRLVALALLAATAPVIWMGMDAAVTGRPLHSLVHTQEASGVSSVPSQGLGTNTTAAEAGPGPASRGISGRLRYAVTSYKDVLRSILRLPVLAATLLGLGLALALAARRTRLLLALLVLGTISYLSLGLGGIFLMDRFAFLAAGMLAIFAAFAMLGWLRPESRGRWRPAWIAAGLLLALGFAASLPSQASRLKGLRDRATVRSTAVGDLNDLARAPAAAAAFRSCPRVSTQTYRAVPFVAYTLDRRPQQIPRSPLGPPREGAFLVAARPAVETEFLRHSAHDTPLPHPPFAGFREVSRNGSWILVAKGC